MRNQKVNYLVVGLFVLGMLVALIVSLAVLTGRTGATDTYYTTLGNVTGIKYGTQVLYEGYIVGQVESVTPVEEEGRMRFRIEMSVIENWKVPDDSAIRPMASGLLAAKTLQISAGVNNVYLDPGDVIPSAESADMFAAMADVASTVGDLAEHSLKPLIASLQDAVTTFNDLLRDDGAPMVRDFRAVAGQLNSSLPTLVADMEAITGNIRDASLQVRGMAGSAEAMLGNVDAGVVDFRRMARDMAALARELRGTRGRLDHLLDQSGQLVGDNRAAVSEAVEDLRYTLGSIARHIDSVNQNLEGTARNMFEFSRQIRQNPGLLIGGAAPADEARR